MSKLTELLDEISSGEVVRARFSDVCDYVRGVTYKKDQEVTSCTLGGIKLLRANNITVGSNTLNFDDVKCVSPEVKVSERQKLSAGDILICAGSGSREHVGKVAFIEEGMPYTFGGFMAVIRTSDDLRSRYFYHVLSSGLFKSYLQTALTSTTINNLSARIMANFTFPLPPLKVQQEIVQMLDAFTDLEQSLVSELELRTTQMSEYIDDIFENLDAESTTLGSVGKFTRGSSLQKKDFVDSGIPCMHYGQVFTQYGLSTKNTVAFVTTQFAAGKRTMKPGDLFVATTSENDEDLGKAVAWLGHEEVVVGTDAYIYSHDLDPKFVSYFFASSSFQLQKRRFITGTKVRRISDKAMSTFEIKVPAREVQQDIVTQLDAFEALIQSIEQEISLRRKQYEFYRDELLRFTPRET
ncbi:restriction endonuclease subunit S [Enteractinococcus helveticum]|uniref:Type I restriction modification DNA specificity domain-containing protein n=1 Tax=Enteractinococcus helveticum TaxID=1837282 RepID=A0A1B7LVF3_9MICC|nr:restriction endonuclease subunit S [Enteractinococcus helveticum]OAV52202.1 hypothetical protein A6F49_00855 [Enteractinococcus helveticum]